jgi:16S rRNA (cytosine1402-N4)-methyltransferase
LETLDIQEDDTVLDGTLGGAGHAAAMCAKLGSRGTFIGIDADHDAVKRAEERLKTSVAKVVLVEGNFRNIGSYLGKHGIQSLDRAFFDLGWSSYQLDAGRGFSFLNNEPLLMTFSSQVGDHTLTAGRIVNEWEESSLADILYGWGEEKFSRRIARAIVEARKEKDIASSAELASIIRGAVPAFYRKGRIHPATKTFQALRIATNDEMGSLKEGLHAAWTHLNSGGRLAVLSFHSVEDREVKNIMREWESRDEGKRVLKKPVQASREEIAANPRARSAKLRCIQKY